MASQKKPASKKKSAAGKKSRLADLPKARNELSAAQAKAVKGGAPTAILNKLKWPD